MIDTHAHLHEIADLDSAIFRAKETGLTAIIAVGLDYPSNNTVLELVAKYPQFVFPALGFYPEYAGATAKEHEQNFKFVEDNIEDIVAIGEIGLDYLKKVVKEASKDAQRHLFKDALWLARKYDKPALIHSRYAWRDALNLVKECKVEKAVFHWYSGPLSTLKDIVAGGYYVSAAPAAAYHPDHRLAIAAAPLENLLLETDCPVVYRGGDEEYRPSEPADILNVLKSVTRLLGVDAEKVKLQTTVNAQRFFLI